MNKAIIEQINSKHRSYYYSDNNDGSELWSFIRDVLSSGQYAPVPDDLSLGTTGNICGYYHAAIAYLNGTYDEWVKLNPYSMRSTYPSFNSPYNNTNEDWKQRRAEQQYEAYKHLIRE